MAQFPLRKIFRNSAPGNKDGSPGKSFGIALSAPMALVLGLFLVCALGWSFLMGFMVGRGQNPETRIQEMTEFLHGEKNREPVASGAPADAPSPPETATGQEIQPDDSVPKVNVPPAPQSAPAGQADSTHPFNRPITNGLDAWGARPEGSSTPGDTQPAAKKTEARPAPAAAKKQYDYTFQAAAFKNSRDAEKLRQTLEGKKIRAKVQKSGKVFLVVINLRGDENAPRELASRLAALKLGKPLLLSRKSITPKATRKR